jgi:hypothetical protein
MGNGEERYMAKRCAGAGVAYLLVEVESGGYTTGLQHGHRGVQLAPVPHPHDPVQRPAHCTAVAMTHHMSQPPPAPMVEGGEGLTDGGIVVAVDADAADPTRVFNVSGAFALAHVP